MPVKRFLDLGKQPLANGFMREVKNELFYNLSYSFDSKLKLIKMDEILPPAIMFNDNYVYHSSGSQTMRDHFKVAAELFRDKYKPNSVLEIGSNDGVFIKHFDKQTTIAVEPCGNFAEITNNMGYTTYHRFWTKELSREIVKNHDKFDLIFSANCICHIPDLDDTFEAIHEVLSDNGIFVFEDPSLLRMILRSSYDQLYDEHPWMFSVAGLSNLLKGHGLEIFDVSSLDVHGGSNRILVKKASNREIKTEIGLLNHLFMEDELGINDFESYIMFSKKVEESRFQLLRVLNELKSSDKKVIGYGAAAKTTTIFNYCGIDRSLISYLVDNTIDKQGTVSPGMHIPVVSPEEGLIADVDVMFLGAWNFTKEIVEKEQVYAKNKRWLTHVPFVRCI